jgi:peptidoglycan hydrolase-like protein with peptidoglycan-binding domain
MIQRGSKGEEVRQWQEFLAMLEYEIDIDGTFGADTHDATAHFQEEEGLDADGIVGPDTYAVAFELGYEGDYGYEEEVEEEEEEEEEVPMIQQGSQGKEVRQWQKFLVSLGYEIDIDGIFGEDTHAATAHFQEEEDLDADGIVGPDTYAAALENGYEGDFA